MRCRSCIEKCITIFLRPLDWGISSLFKVIESNSSRSVGKILSSSSLILTFLLCCYLINAPLTLLVDKFKWKSLHVSILHSLRKNIVGINIIHIFVECYLNYMFNFQNLVIEVFLTTTWILFYWCTPCKKLNKFLDGLICMWVMVSFN